MSEAEDKAGTGKKKLKTYQEARLQHTENLRKLVVDAAAQLLQEEGPEAVTVRKVATKMDCSTKIIYSLFVNKEGLAQQLYLDGCQLLAKQLEHAPQATDPAQQLLNLGEAYWRFGKVYASYYKLMFGGAFADFKPDAESLQGTVTALQQLLQVVAEAREQGVLSDKYDEQSAIRVLWAALHGVIHLYLGGHLADEDTAYITYRDTLSAVVRALIPK